MQYIRPNPISGGASGFLDPRITPGGITPPLSPPDKTNALPTPLPPSPAPTPGMTPPTPVDTSAPDPSTFKPGGQRFPGFPIQAGGLQAHPAIAAFLERLRSRIGQRSAPPLPPAPAVLS